MAKKEYMVLATLALALIMALNSTAPTAHAQSPAVDITPNSGLPGTAFAFIVTAVDGPTTIVGPSPIPTYPPSISVVGPPAFAGDIWLLADSSGSTTLSFILPDVGDAVSITFPGAVVAVVNDPNGNVVLPALPCSWVGGVPPSTTALGTYAFSIAGTETPIATFYFDVSTFLVIPETPLGSVAILFAGLAGLAGVFGFRRFKGTF